MSDDVIRALYLEGKRRKQPMTKLADLLIRQAFAASSTFTVLPDPKPAAAPDRHVA